MKPALSLSIASPCAEKWSEFTPVANGGLCGSCAKVVVDFTRMSDAEVVEFFKKKEAYTCGRFRADQLKIYSVLHPAKINSGFTLLKEGVVSLLLLVVSKQGTSQTMMAKANTENIQHLHGEVMPVNQKSVIRQKVSGIVKAEEAGLVLPGVNVMLKGSTVGTFSDMEGRFQFPEQLKAGDVLVFSFIGLVTQEYVVPEGKDNDEVIVMAMDMKTCDMVIMGEVATDGVYAERPTGLRKLWSMMKNLF